MGPTENTITESKVSKPSLRKDSDNQKGVSNWVNEATNNLKTKSLWVQRFYRNPNRKPFPWNLNTDCEEEGEGKLESREGGIDTREEDIDCLNEWNSSDSEDTEENLSVPESDGETDPPNTGDILQDVSMLFKDETENNTHQVTNRLAENQGGFSQDSILIPVNQNTEKTVNPNSELSDLEGEEVLREGEDVLGRPFSEMTLEEWKIINKVVVGVELQEVPKPDYKGTNRGKNKKGTRELRGLQSSFNDEGSSRNRREKKIVK